MQVPACSNYELRVIKLYKFICDNLAPNVKFRRILNNVFGLRRYSALYAYDASGDAYDRSAVGYVF